MKKLMNTLINSILAGLSHHPPWLALLLLTVPIASLGVWSEEAQAVLSGMSAYLMVVTGFTVLGRRQGAWPALTQLGTAAALGIAVGLLVAQYSTKPPVEHALAATVGHDGTMEVTPVPTASDADPLKSLEVFAAVLAVALAVLALVAQKSASEARMEAEKAHQLVLGAWDIRLASFLARLALESQRLRENQRIQVDHFDSQAALNNFDLAACHQLWSSYWHQMAGALVDLWHGSSTPRPLAGVTGNTMTRLAGQIITQHENLGPDQQAFTLWREQQRDYVQPLQQLLTEGIRLLDDLSATGPNASHHTELREALRQLESSLRVLA